MSIIIESAPLWVQGEHDMKKKLSTIILILIFFSGLFLLLYPTFSDYYNSLHQSRAVADYSTQVSELNEEEYERFLEEAKKYNEKLAQRFVTSFVMSEEENMEYESLLNMTDVMSYIEIPSIRCTLPIYHGTSAPVLEAGVGHITGSSLPVGGESSHCVLSGHRGLPTAKLFTNLDKLVEGDIFVLRTLNEKITYEVDQIRIVEPEDMSALEIVSGEDYCTLVTCTPYGVNTQRLLVRGHRIENIQELSSNYVTANAIQIEPILIVPFVAIPIFVFMLILVLRKPCHKKSI